MTVISKKTVIVGYAGHLLGVCGEGLSTTPAAALGALVNKRSFKRAGV